MASFQSSGEFDALLLGPIGLKAVVGVLIAYYVEDIGVNLLEATNPGDEHVSSSIRAERGWGGGVLI